MARKPAQAQPERGTEARSPGEIPRAGWREILVRVKDSASEHQLSIVAAGVAFYVLLAIVPALAATVSIYGLVADPATLERQLEAMAGALPEDAYSIIAGQLEDIVAASGGALGLGLAVSLLFSLWSASAGVKTLMTALNIAYAEKERRGFLRFNGVALLLTLALILVGIVAIALVVALPAVLGFVGLGGVAELIINLLRWPLLAAAVILALSLAYTYGPSRARAQWRWISAGAVAATVLWLIASGLFSFYVSNFGNYNETYGSLGAVVILLMWLFISAYVVLLGAELNAEMEHQTRFDTTTGEPRPMGEREAQMADRVARDRR
jgi:membrane protein